MFKITGILKPLIFAFLLSIPLNSISQIGDSTKSPAGFSGAVIITNKGISTIPNLTLGKPAAIFDLSMGRRLTFEPQLRFALEGKPWSFLFWWRYKLISTEKFRFNIGAHPALSFKTRSFIIDGVPKDKIVTDRYLASELAPGYVLSKNINIGMYYLYSHGMEEDITQNTHFISFRASFSDIKLTNSYFMRFNPQIYYLKMDKNDGYYYNATFSIARRNFPLSVSALINKTISTNIPVGKDFLWNISLVYAFNKKFIETTGR